MKNLSIAELESIISQTNKLPEEKITVAKNLLNKRMDSLGYARTQIENEVGVDEILAQFKRDGIDEKMASKIIQDASINADLDEKEKEEIA